MKTIRKSSLNTAFTALYISGVIAFLCHVCDINLSNYAYYVFHKYNVKHQLSGYFDIKPPSVKLLISMITILVFGIKYTYLLYQKDLKEHIASHKITRSDSITGIKYGVIFSTLYGLLSLCLHSSMITNNVMLVGTTFPGIFALGIVIGNGFGTIYSQKIAFFFASTLVTVIPFVSVFLFSIIHFDYGILESILYSIYAGVGSFMVITIFNSILPFCIAFIEQVICFFKNMFKKQQTTVSERSI
ncbi:MAG: hypothetical protein ACI9AR_000612 [Flavobacteriaceae bacterium]|jgi:hypothetical protein